MIKNIEKPGIFLLISLVLSVATTAIFFKTTGFDYIRSFDDTLYVVENTHIKDGLTWEGIRWAFLTTYAANWHPLTWISHMVDVDLFGIDPGGHHTTNIFFHVSNTLLLFALFLRMSGSVWSSAFAAALFALHPLHVESIAWVSERKDLLSAFFGFLTFHFYISYVKKGGVLLYVFSCILFTLSLMSKPMLVSLPILLLLLDYWPLQRLYIFAEDKNVASKKKGTLLLEKLPFFGLAAVSCILTLIAQGSAGSISSLEKISPVVRLSNALISYMSYLIKTLYPHDLSIFYPYPVQIEIWKVVLSGIILSGITAILLLFFRKKRYLLTGWLWFLITLLPVIGLVQVGEQAMADRYMYMPIIGLFVIFAWAAKEIAERWNIFHMSVVGIAALSIGFSGWLSIRQVEFWKNSKTLFAHAIEVTENNKTAHHNLAVAYSAEGDLKMAMEHYREVLKIDKNDPLANSNLGLVYVKSGEVDKGISQYRIAIQSQPSLFEAHFNLGIALTAKRKYKDALKEFQKVIALQPNYASAFYRAGIACTQEGQIDKAISYYKQTIQVDPGFAKAYVNLGILLEDYKREPIKAIAAYRDAIRVNPDFYQAYNTLGVSMAKQKKMKEAIDNFLKALTINPNYKNAKRNLKRAKGKMSRK